MSPHYIGRFAPSPTGPLHFGSLIAATGSYLRARQQGGSWLLRMEDLDPPREVAGAADDILRTLDNYGFQWDGPVVYQSRRSAAYEQALETLRERGISFDCACTRKEISLAGGIYPGTCRNGLPAGKSPRAVRINTSGARIRFEDLIQGPITEDLQQDVGDFVLRRADGLYAYQLAVVVDDATQGITEVMRGKDLLDSTARQIYLQQQLGYDSPAYAHLPIVVNARGEKLSKQTHAAPLPARQASAQIVRALNFLGQAAPAELGRASIREVWDWGLKHWQLTRVPPEQASQ